jgi:hypothetical protein
VQSMFVKALSLRISSKAFSPSRDNTAFNW